VWCARACVRACVRARARVDVDMCIKLTFPHKLVSDLDIKD